MASNGRDPKPPRPSEPPKLRPPRPTRPPAPKPPRQSQWKSCQGSYCLEVIKGGGDLILMKDKRTRVRKKHFVLGEEFLSCYKDATEKEKTSRKSSGSSLMCGMGSKPKQKDWYTFDFKEIREGAMSNTFDKASKKMTVTEDCSFSILYGEKDDTVDLVAPDAQTKDLWVKGLRHLLKRRRGANLATQQETWIREMFKHADKNGDGVLDLKEVKNLLKMMNMDVDTETAKDVIKLADTSQSRNKKGEDCLDISEFLNFYRLLTRRDELNELFMRYSSDEGKTMDIDDLRSFFNDEQKVDMEKYYGKHIFEELIEEYEPCPQSKQNKVMSLGGFTSMVTAPVRETKQPKYSRKVPIMGVFQPLHSRIYQSMSEPLSHYFIDSSHNTYLTAGQLRGDSSIEAYIRALKMGCRCVELDCWDGDKGEPVIYHGYTLTSKIYFKDVIEAIDKYAFYATDYPVILSIENHCSKDQQKRMANYMRTILKEKLFLTPLPPNKTVLPSPADLKWKVVVKAKKLPEPKTPDAVDGPGCDDDEDDDDDDDDDDMDASEEIKKEKQICKHEEEIKKKVSQELSDCVIICQASKFKEFRTESTYKYKKMSSFSESRSLGLLKENTTNWIEHNRWQISRIYPKGLRTDSSNYDPMQMWIAGCQIVALNYQTRDDHMHTNQGMFENNGKCGYILKPDFMRNGRGFDPNAERQPSAWKEILKIHIISGFQLPKKEGDKTKSILDPYVMVEILGIPADENSRNTETIKNNGFHPVWKEELTFDIRCPELALVKFRVFDQGGVSSDEEVAHYSLPYTCLQTGYRTVHLKNRNDEYLWGSSLFVHIDKCRK